MQVTPAEIVTFWREAGYESWFTKNDGFDETVRAKFLPVQEAAARGELAAWEDSAEGALALLLLLDQFPRNMFRGSARSFTTDPLARAVAQRTLLRGFDQAIENPMRQFFYLPFMHSESLADQEHCVRLYQELDSPKQLKYATDHRDIIAKFGRFPHRNALLGRQTTPDEQAFLDGGGFAG